MKIEVDANRHIVLKEVFSGVLIETTEGNQIAVCARDDTFEINILPKGFKEHYWQRVDMQGKRVVAMDNHSIEPTGKSCASSDKPD